MTDAGGVPQVDVPRSASDSDITVVVATIPANSHETVSRLLQAQSFAGEWEILVVNDPAMDRCEARNLGLRKANAPVVAFTDDDTEPPADWIASIHEAFQSNPDLICLEGRVTGGIRYAGEGRYVGCNMAVRRDAAIAVGGWDSRFAGWREDTELGWRLERDGDGVCSYRDDVVMVHPDVPRSRFDAEHEARLRDAYPTRYESRFNRNLTERLWRFGQTSGVIASLNRVRKVFW